MTREKFYWPWVFLGIFSVNSLRSVACENPDSRQQGPSCQDPHQCHTELVWVNVENVGWLHYILGFVTIRKKSHLTVVTGRALSAMAAGIHASSWHSFTRVCLTPTPAERPPAAFKDTTHQPPWLISGTLNLKPFEMIVLLYSVSAMESGLICTHQIVQNSRVCLLSFGASSQPHTDFPTVTDGVTIDMDSIPFHPKKTWSTVSQSAHALSLS